MRRSARRRTMRRCVGCWTPLHRAARRVTCWRSTGGCCGGCAGASPDLAANPPPSAIGIPQTTLGPNLSTIPFEPT
eukprot:6129795-Prymnesium_polylepis.1